MKSLKGHMFYVSELSDKLLVASKGLVKLDVVHRNLGGVDEGDGDLGGVETCHIQPNQQVRAGVNFDRMDLKEKSFLLSDAAISTSRKVNKASVICN